MPERRRAPRRIDDDRVLGLLRCPTCGSAIVRDGPDLRCEGGHRVRVDGRGIPRFAELGLSGAGRIQERHYDSVAGGYLDNIDLPQTVVYTAHLDQAVLDALPEGRIGRVIEICCGQGDGLRLVGARADLAVGLDVSASMLAAADERLADDGALLVQADATQIPFQCGVFDVVLSLGGIHHVPGRRQLFEELFRVLRPGGRLVLREPLNDAAPWRMVRALVYRLSPALDAETERPLLSEETCAELEAAGFEVLRWRPYGLLGFMLLMNSDVLVLNRILRYLPGVEGLTRLWARVDDLSLAFPGLGRAGLQVVGVARRPPEGGAP